MHTCLGYYLVGISDDDNVVLPGGVFVCPESLVGYELLTERVLTAPVVCTYVHVHIYMQL